MDYVLKRSKRQSVQIQIEYDGALIVKAPLTYPLYKVDAFVETKKEWIKKHRTDIAKNDIYKENHIHILGKNYPILHKKSLRNHIEISDNALTVETAGSKDYSDIITKKFKCDAVDYLRKRFDLILQNTQPLGLYTNHPVKIRKFKRKWGCCSYSGQITLNYKLYHAPEHIIDSVIYHELCHLKHFNHSADFYKLLLSFDPYYKKHNDILKQYAFYLVE